MVSLRFVSVRRSQKWGQWSMALCFLGFSSRVENVLGSSLLTRRPHNQYETGEEDWI